MSREALSIGSDTRAPVLFRGHYSQWKDRFEDFIDRLDNGNLIMESYKEGPATFKIEVPTEVLDAEGKATTKFITRPLSEKKTALTQNEQDRLKADKAARTYLIQGLSDELYNQVDSYKTAKDMWNAVAKMMLGSEMSSKAKMTAILSSYETFRATKTETVKQTHDRFLTLLNELRRNGIHKSNLELNLKFLKNLEPAWKAQSMNVIQNCDINALDIYDIAECLNLHQDDISEIQGLPPSNSSPSQDSFALVAEKHHRSKSSKHEASKFEEYDTASEEDEDVSVQKSLALLTTALNKKFYKKPANNQLRTSSYSRRPEYQVSPPQYTQQSAPVQYQNSKTDHLSSSPQRNNQEASDRPKFESAPRDTEKSKFKTSETRKCYNCQKIGHVAKDCRLPRQRDANYYMQKMLLCKQEAAGAVLLAEDAQWLDDTDEDEIEDLEVNMCMMGTITKVHDPDAPVSSDTEEEEVHSKLFQSEYKKVASDLAIRLQKEQAKVKVLKLKCDKQKATLECTSQEKTNILARLDTLMSECASNLHLDDLKDHTIEECRTSAQHWKSLFHIKQAESLKFLQLQLDAINEAKAANSFKTSLEKKYKLLEEKYSCIKSKLTQSEHDCGVFEVKYNALFKERKQLYLKIKELEDAFLKRGQSDQTIFLNKPKDFRFYNPSEGIGFDNPMYHEKAVNHSPELYGSNFKNYKDYGVVQHFMYNPDEDLEDEAFRRSQYKFPQKPFEYTELNNQIWETNQQSNEYFPCYEQPELTVSNPIIQISGPRLYVPNTVLHRKIQDLENQLILKDIKFSQMTKLFQRKIHGLESNLKAKSSRAPFLLSIEAAPFVPSNTASEPKINHHTDNALHVPTKDSLSISADEFDDFMNAEVDDESITPPLNCNIDLIIDPPGMQHIPSTKRVRRRRSKSNSRNHRNCSGNPPILPTPPGKPNKGKTNTCKISTSGKPQYLRRNLWRHKPVPNRSTSSPRFAQAASCSSFNILQEASNLPCQNISRTKTSYSFTDLLACNNSSTLNNIISIGDAMLKFLFRPLCMNIEFSYNNPIPVTISKWVPKSICSSGPIPKWEPPKS